MKHRRGGLTQTAKRYDYALKKAALEKSAREALVEFDQMLADSGRLGRTEIVLPFIEPHRHLQQFAMDMLQAEGLASRLQLLLFNSKVRLDRKIRFFSFCAFPFLTSLLMNMKNTLRGRSVHSGETKKA